jgi:NADH:ubiquinone oxidoreductase subunit H
LVAVLALAFDLLFFAVDELPSTVPVAVALALVTWWERKGRAAAQL